MRGRSKSFSTYFIDSAHVEASRRRRFFADFKGYAGVVFPWFAAGVGCCAGVDGEVGLVGGGFLAGEAGHYVFCSL